MNSIETMKCPCCGKSYVLKYEICTVCLWQNDPIQLRKPDYHGGANRMSLNEARIAYENGEKVI